MFVRIENGHHGCVGARVCRPKAARPPACEPRPVEPIPFDKYLRRVNREDSTEMWRHRAEPACERGAPAPPAVREQTAPAPAAEPRSANRHPLSPARIGDVSPVPVETARCARVPPATPVGPGSLIDLMA